jgi:hypothetical protein
LADRERLVSWETRFAPETMSSLQARFVRPPVVGGGGVVPLPLPPHAPSKASEPARRARDSAVANLREDGRRRRASARRKTASMSPAISKIGGRGCGMAGVGATFPELLVVVQAERIVS